MRFAFSGPGGEKRFDWFRSGLQAVMEGHGHACVGAGEEGALLIDFTDPNRPMRLRRKAKHDFVVAVTPIAPPFGELMEKGYPLLVRSLGNLLIGLVEEGHPLPTAHFVTPEQGHYVVEGDRGLDSYFEAVYERIHPLATSRRVLGNIFDTDLEPELWRGDERSESVSWAGRRLYDMDLLQSPFPLEKYLTEEEQKHFRLLLGVNGLSYGNFSARLDADRFWMSASGVDKSDLREIGRDILLVKGFDPERNAMILSVPPNVEPRRVSVDAIEHWMLYRDHPHVGAIVHVHAWMDGVPSTEFNYPCGTLELAQAVANSVRGLPRPWKAVVGLKNHGLTILGESMAEIFGRVGERLYQPVPMA